MKLSTIILLLIVANPIHALQRKVVVKKPAQAVEGPFTLPPLPYRYNALEPFIDTQTMRLHHDGHHKAYVDNLNQAVKNYPHLRNKTVEELLMSLEQVPRNVRKAVRNNAGGHFNHSMFWLSLGKKSPQEPTGALKAGIIKDFGSFALFKEKFTDAAKTVFGSGWVWLCMNKDGSLSIITTANQDAPLELGLTPLLPFDVWEHAYYLKYKNKRLDYINAWWSVVNWDYVEENYRKATASIKTSQRPLHLKLTPTMVH